MQPLEVGVGRRRERDELGVAAEGQVGPALGRAVVRGDGHDVGVARRGAAGPERADAEEDGRAGRERAVERKRARIGGQVGPCRHERPGRAGRAFDLEPGLVEVGVVEEEGDPVGAQGGAAEVARRERVVGRSGYRVRAGDGLEGRALDRLPELDARAAAVFDHADFDRVAGPGDEVDRGQDVLRGPEVGAAACAEVVEVDDRGTGGRVEQEQRHAVVAAQAEPVGPGHFGLERAVVDDRELVGADRGIGGAAAPVFVDDRLEGHDGFGHLGAVGEVDVVEVPFAQPGARNGNHDRVSQDRRRIRRPARAEGADAVDEALAGDRDGVDKGKGLAADAGGRSVNGAGIGKGAAVDAALEGEAAFVQRIVGNGDRDGADAAAGRGPPMGRAVPRSPRC